MGIAIIITKKISKEDSAKTIVAYSQFGIFLFSLIIFSFHISYLKLSSSISIVTLISTNMLQSRNDLITLLFIASLAVVSQYSYTKAISEGEVSSVAPYEYTRLLYALPIGYLFFNEIISINHIIGGALIIFSSLFLIKQSKEIPYNLGEKKIGSIKKIKEKKLSA